MIRSGRGPMPLWGAILLWCFAMVLTLAIGGSVVDDASLGARALDEGVKGTFTGSHTESASSKSTRLHWVGTFVSDDGETTTSGVWLRQNETVHRSSPEPVDRVAYLIVDPTTDDPVAYTADYDTDSRVGLGIAVMVIGTLLVTAAFIRYWVRRRRTSSPRPRREPPRELDRRKGER